MDWVLKLVLTAATVWLVMTVAGRGGRRLAGVAAALPTITAPTLAWLIHERGADFALGAAVASVSACAMLAAFALAYALAARRGGRVRALGWGLVGALAMGWPAHAASDCLADALMLALGCSALALCFMPRGAAEGVARVHPHRALAGAVLATVGLTALAATVGPALGSFATGLLSSLPVISGAVAMVEHGRGGHVAAAHFMRGYARGLFGKAAFGAAFVLLTPWLGAAVALALGCACAALVALARPGARSVQSVQRAGLPAREGG